MALFKIPKMLIWLPFFTEDEPQEAFVIERTGLVVIIPRRHLEPTFRQPAHVHRETVTFPVENLGGLHGFAYEDEGLVLGKVAAELLIHYSLQTLELLSHIHRLHAKEILEICM